MNYLNHIKKSQKGSSNFRQILQQGKIVRNFSQVTNQKLETDVCIVGSGPVGMVLSRMLNRLNVKTIVIEKRPSLHNHPKAHYLSFRTCEILEDLLEDNILKNQLEKFDQWNKFDYCTSVAAEPFARVQHFQEQDISSWSKFSYAYPSHYS